MTDSLWFSEEQSTKKKWWKKLKPSLTVTTSQIEESNDYLNYLKSFSSNSISSPFAIEHVAHVNDDSNFGFSELFPNVQQDLLSDLNINLNKTHQRKASDEKPKTSPLTKKLGYSSFVTPTSPNYKRDRLKKSESNHSSNSIEKYDKAKRERELQKELRLNQINFNLNQAISAPDKPTPIEKDLEYKLETKEKSKEKSEIFTELNKISATQDHFLNWSPSTKSQSIFNLNYTPNSSSEELIESIINFKMVGELSQFQRKNKSPNRYKGSIDDFNEVLNNDDINDLDVDFEEDEDGFEYVKKIIDKSFKYQSVLLPEL